MAEPETPTVANLRSRICEARNLVEAIRHDARSLWEMAPANSFVERVTDNMTNELEDIANALGELED